MKTRYIIKNLSESITLEPLARELRFHNISDSDLGRIGDAWIAVQDGKIHAIGSGTPPPTYQSWHTLNAKNCIALPGLIDSHTHPVFAGIRAEEFCMRLDGATYQEIAQNGGGIQSTVRNTSLSSDSDLENLVRARLLTFAKHGVTTVEAKSGYGLTISEELRHLRILKKVANSSAQTIKATCLALHAVPKTSSSAKSWADQCAHELLPTVKHESLADAVDVFIESGYFSVEDCAKFLTTARDLQLDIRLHADEFSDARAAACAAKFNALSADHLQFASPDGIKSMAEAGVVATLLPGTSLYTSIPYTDSRPFKAAGCPVALATDFNPGSCPVDNLRLVLTMGALHCKLSKSEAVAAVTWVAARALRLESSKGALTVGRDADILIMPLQNVEEFIADLGRASPAWVIAKGHILVGKEPTI